jgi:hypothetical protein
LKHKRGVNTVSLNPQTFDKSIRTLANATLQTSRMAVRNTKEKKSGGEQSPFGWSGLYTPSPALAICPPGRGHPQGLSARKLNFGHITHPTQELSTKYLIQLTKNGQPRVTESGLRVNTNPSETPDFLLDCIKLHKSTID